MLTNTRTEVAEGTHNRLRLTSTDSKSLYDSEMRTEMEPFYEYGPFNILTELDTMDAVRVSDTPHSFKRKKIKMTRF